MWELPPLDSCFKRFGKSAKVLRTQTYEGIGQVGNRLLNSGNNLADHIKGFQSLGLTPTQAKIYITMLRLGKPTAKQLARASNIDRPDVYRVTADLLERGLASKVISNPVRYEPVSFEDAVQTLHSQKVNEFGRIVAGLDDIGKKFNLSPAAGTAPEIDQFSLIAAEELSNTRLRKLFETAKNDLVIMTPKKRCLQWLTSYYDCTLQSLKKKVSHRIITEQPLDGEITKEMKKLAKHSNFQMRFLKSPLPVWFRIVDSKILILQTTVTLEPNSSAIWSSNKSLIVMAESYFNFVWETGEEPKF